MFALRDGIGRYKTDLCRALLHVFTGLDKPRGDVIEGAPAFAQRGDVAYLFALRWRLEFCTHKRRITQHIRTFAGRKKVVPIGLQRVSVPNMRRLFQRNTCISLAELQAQAIVHQVIHHPQCDFGNVRRKFSQLNPVELIHIDNRKQLRQNIELTMGTNLLEHLDFQRPQLAVGNDEKIAAAAGRIEKAQLTEPSLKGNHFRDAPTVTTRLEVVELGTQSIEKQRFNDLEDVLFGGVMRSLCPALVLVHDGLKERTEDRRRNTRPIKGTGIDQTLAHFGIKRWNEQWVAE